MLRQMAADRERRAVVLKAEGEREFIGLPQQSVGRLPASILRTISRRAIFRGRRYFVMFRPPSLLAPRIVPTAANTAAGQLGLLRPSISCVVASTRPGYANRLNTGK